MTENCTKMTIIGFCNFSMIIRGENYKCLFSQASNKLENHAAGSAEKFLLDHLQNSSLAVDHNLVYFAVARE